MVPSLLMRRLATVGVGGVAYAVGTIGIAACADDKAPPTPSFDPEALERGAKALREINASPHAKKVRDEVAPRPGRKYVRLSSV